MRALRTCGEAYGFWQDSGILYKQVNGLLCKVIVFVPPSGNGRELKAWMSCRPVELDAVHCDLFQMKTRQASYPAPVQPHGSFTAGMYSLGEQTRQVPSPQMVQSALEALLKQCNQTVLRAAGKMGTVEDFSKAIERVPSQAPNQILCKIYAGEYESALKIIEKQLKKKGPDRTAVLTAKAYCRQKLSDRERDAKEPF